MAEEYEDFEYIPDEIDLLSNEINPKNNKRNSTQTNERKIKSSTDQKQQNFKL